VIIRNTLFVVIGLGTALGAVADPELLVLDSPFGSAAAHGPPGLRPAPYELRGIMATPDGVRYLIYFTARKSSVWAAVREPGNPFLITSANPDSDEVTLDENGRTLTLNLRESHVAALPESSGAGSTGHPETTVHSAPGRRPGEPRAPRAETP
jgi:hypothetical protein